MHAGEERARHVPRPAPASAPRPSAARSGCGVPLTTPPPGSSQRRSTASALIRVALAPVCDSALQGGGAHLPLHMREADHGSSAAGSVAGSAPAAARRRPAAPAARRRPAPPARPPAARRRPARRPGRPAPATGTRLAAIRPTIGRPTSRMRGQRHQGQQRAFGQPRAAAPGDSGRPRKPAGLGRHAPPRRSAWRRPRPGRRAARRSRRRCAPGRRCGPAPPACVRASAARRRPAARDAVHQHGDREAPDHRMFAQRVAGGAADLVIRRLLLPVLRRCRRRPAPRCPAGCRRPWSAAARRRGSARSSSAGCGRPGSPGRTAPRASRPGRNPSRPSPRPGPGRGRGCVPAIPRPPGRGAAPARGGSPPAPWRPAAGPAERLAAARQQLAAAVDDGDVLRLQPGHGGGDQVQHRLHALRGPAAGRPAWPGPRWPGPRPARARRLPAAAAPGGPGRVRTPARPRMVRASSPSSARSRFTSCWKGVVVRLSPRSKISQPTPPPAGRPSRASSSRRRGTWSAGASTWVPPPADAVGDALAFERGDHGGGVARLQLAEQRGHRRVAGPQRQRRQQAEQRRGRPRPAPAAASAPAPSARREPRPSRPSLAARGPRRLPVRPCRAGFRRCRAARGRASPQAGIAGWRLRSRLSCAGRRATTALLEGSSDLHGFVTLIFPPRRAECGASAALGSRREGVRPGHEDRRLQQQSSAGRSGGRLARPAADQRLHPALRRHGGLRRDQRERPRRGRLRGAVHQLPGERQPDGAADHAGRAEARLAPGGSPR